MSKKTNDKNDKRGPIRQVLMKQWEAKWWAPFFELLGISEEASERMTRLLVMHLLLDRAVTGVLTTRMLDRSKPSFSEIEATLAHLEMDARIDLAKAAHLISDSCASDMKTVNTVRNKLAHYQPKKGWGVEHVQELSSAKAFEQCIEKGTRAFREIVDTIDRNLKEISPTR